MLRVIALSGKARSGKDSFSDIAKEYLTKFGIQVKRIGFADYLKELTVQYFPFADIVKKDPISRSVLQGLGQFARDHADIDFWVKPVLNRITQEHLENPTQDTLVLITDTRHPNEADAIRQKKWLPNEVETKIVRVIRPTNPDGLIGEAAQHISETGLDAYDFDDVLENTGTYQEYVDTVERYLDQLYGRIRQ